MIRFATTPAAPVTTSLTAETTRVLDLADSLGFEVTHPFKPYRGADEFALSRGAEMLGCRGCGRPYRADHPGERVRRSHQDHPPCDRCARGSHHAPLSRLRESVSEPPESRGLFRVYRLDFRALAGEDKGMTGHEHGDCGCGDLILRVGDVVDFAGQPGYIAGTVQEINRDRAVLVDDIMGTRRVWLSAITKHRHTFRCDCD